MFMESMNGRPMMTSAVRTARTMSNAEADCGLREWSCMD